MGDAISEPEENIYAKELVSGNIISGYPGRFDFAENATSITHIEFEPLMTFKRTITTAEVLLNKSVFIPELPTGRVYQYINVFVGTKGAGLPTFLKSGLVEFKVEKAWIKDNNVDESQVTLQRYNYGWVPLHTEKVGEDDKYVYFKADTPGFYFFAITEEKGEMNTS
jgi:PGF-pre-PGF domain-containing protein